MSEDLDTRVGNLEGRVGRLEAEPRQSPADHIVYKGKAALQFSLKSGKPTPMDTRRGKYIGTDKGCLFITGANALGPRDYDWKNKITISLNEHEVAKLMVALRLGEAQKFYHDPNKGKDDEGKLVKNLSVSKSGDTIFMNLSMTANGEQKKIEGVPFDKSEALGLHTLLASALPKILGW